jgi:hypothetical protein
MRTKITVAALCMALGACGDGRNDVAAEACSNAIAEKLAGKNISLDRKDMARGAHDEAADVINVASTIVFDKGLSTEYDQTFDCRVRMENGKPPSVIGLQFNWSKDDLKKAAAQ